MIIVRTPFISGGELGDSDVQPILVAYHPPLARVRLLRFPPGSHVELINYYGVRSFTVIEGSGWALSEGRRVPLALGNQAAAHRGDDVSIGSEPGMTVIETHTDAEAEWAKED